MIFRPSQKLASKIKAGALRELPLAANPLADWSSHVFVANRAQYILLTNTKTLYSTVMHGRGVVDDNTFIQHAMGELREFISDDGHPEIYQRYIASLTGTVQFAKALNRVVIGSMNDQIWHAKVYLAEEGMSPRDAALELNGMPMSSIVLNDGRNYGNPREAFKELTSQLSRI